MPTNASSAASAATGSPLFVTTPSRRRWPRRTIAVAVAGLVAGATVGVIVTRSGGPSGYRTATVATKDLAQRLTSVGAVEPVDRAAVAFPVAGTVSAIDVAVGDAVSAGQALASLDPASLEATVRQQQAALDQAELVLQRALDGESVVSPTSGGSTAAPASASQTALTTVDTDASAVVLLAADPRPTTTTTGSAGPTDDELRAAQDAVLAAQQDVDAKLGTAQQALDSAALVCAAATSAPNPGTGTTTTTTPPTTTPATDPATTAPATTAPTTTPAPSTTAGGVSTTTPETTTTDAASTTTPTVASTTVAAATASVQLVGIVLTSTGSQGSITACQRQLEAVLRAQQDVADAQTALATAATTLDDLLDRRMQALTAPPTTEPPSTDVPGSDAAGPGAQQAQVGQRPSGLAGGGASGSASVSPSSADLIAYQRDVDAAQASVVVAQQALKQGTIASPIDGHIVAVNLSPGDAVTAGSTTATIVVAGDGGYEVTTTVAVADLPKVDVGQQAEVVMDGSRTALDGRVVAIGVAATSTTGATTYPVSISLPAGSEVLDGSVASVAVVTSAAQDALAVPTSAVHTSGTRHTVDVLEDGTLTEVAVGVGTVGDTWTEITSGLSAGQLVVLADLGEALPGSATESSTNSRQNGPGGGFGGPGGQGGPPALPGGGQGGLPGAP